MTEITVFQLAQSGFARFWHDHYLISVSKTLRVNGSGFKYDFRFSVIKNIVKNSIVVEISGQIARFISPLKYIKRGCDCG